MQDNWNWHYLINILNSLFKNFTCKFYFWYSVNLECKFSSYFQSNSSFFFHKENLHLKILSGISFSPSKHNLRNCCWNDFQFHSSTGNPWIRMECCHSIFVFQVTGFQLLFRAKCRWFFKLPFYQKAIVWRLCECAELFKGIEIFSNKANDSLLSKEYFSWYFANFCCVFERRASFSLTFGGNFDQTVQFSKRT